MSLWEPIPTLPGAQVLERSLEAILSPERHLLDLSILTLILTLTLVLTLTMI